MGPVVVVALAPVFGHAANFIERHEDVAVEDFGAERAVETFDVGVLSGFARLDVDEFDAIPQCPLMQGRTDQFGPVIEP